LGGSATGVINFINFTFSAFLGPVFGSRLVEVSNGADMMSLEHYQAGFAPLLLGVGLALILTCFLKETGTASKSSSKQAGPPDTQSATDGNPIVQTRA
jgi:hypothetical protein